MGALARAVKWQILRAYAGPPIPKLTTDQQTNWNNIWFSYGKDAKSQRWYPDHLYDPIKLDVLLWQAFLIEQGILKIDITLVDGSACWAEPILWYTTKQYSDLPAPYNIIYTTAEVSGFTADPSLRYRIRCYPIGTWYWWNVDHWEVEPNGGQFIWALYSGYDYYTRGTCCTGCNINAGSGSWIEATNADMVFRLYEPS